MGVLDTANAVEEVKNAVDILLNNGLLTQEQYEAMVLIARERFSVTLATEVTRLQAEIDKIVDIVIPVDASPEVIDAITEANELRESQRQHFQSQIDTIYRVLE